MGIVRGICISEKRGTKKKQIEEVEIKEGWGLVEDAHGGNWHRQVSLLSLERVKEFQEKGAKVAYGDFGENLVVEGIDFRSLPVGTKVYCNKVVLEITQIGKECHSHCQIYQEMGDCIMPREGVFAKVLSSGWIKIGDEMRVELLGGDRSFRAAVITLSDSAVKGKREDVSGKVLVDRLENANYEVVEYILIADEQKVLEKQLIRLADMRQVDLILTTGGTGFSPRDWTPEGTMAVAHRNAPGIAEGLRAYSMQITKNAMLSRGVSVIRGNSLIVNLPGSPKAVRECTDYLLPVLDHGLQVLRGNVESCGK